MTQLQEVLEGAITGARSVKEHLATTKSGRDADLSNMLMAFRGDKLIAYVYPAQGQNRDALLNCAWAAAYGFAADILALVFETWRATTLTNPRTGQRWAPGEMQECAERYDGVAAGVIQDCVSVAVYNRAGDVLMTVLPYRLGHQKVIWGDAISSDDLYAHGGYLHEQMSRVMAAASTNQTMAAMGVTPAMFGLDHEIAQAHSDCALAKMLARVTPAPAGFPQAQVALAWTEGEAREAVIRESIPDWALRTPPRAT